MVCASNVSTQEAEAGNGFLLEANMVYIASSRLVGQGDIMRLYLKNKQVINKQTEEER